MLLVADIKKEIQITMTRTRKSIWYRKIQYKKIKNSSGNPR